MKLFSYNEKSFLNKSTVRIINYIIFGIILTGGISNATSYSISLWQVILMSFTIAILSAAITYKVISDTDFYEWDYTERKKKFRFTITYMLICVFICSLFAFSIVVAYLIISEDNLSLLGDAIIVFPTAFFAFNLCNIISLYYPIFDGDLTLSHKIQKKPDNWQDSGREIRNEDRVEDIWHRDFGI